MAAIIESLGAIEFSFALPLPSHGAHVLRMKLVSFSQVSSMLMIRVPLSSSGSNRMAYRCLAMMDLTELVPGDIFLVLMKLRLQRCLITCLTSFSVTSRS